MVFIPTRRCAAFFILLILAVASPASLLAQSASAPPETQADIEDSAANRSAAELRSELRKGFPLSAQERRELLRHPSDLGIGLSLGMNRRPLTLDDLRRKPAAPEADPAYPLPWYPGIHDYYWPRYRYGSPWSGRSPLYDWRAPV